MKKILVLHGPNLNLLGSREPTIYGSMTLEQLNNTLVGLALNRDTELECKQSNAEHQLIDYIHTAKKGGVEFIILNAGAYTHTSIALRDALLAVELPFIEVHISNPHAREEFRGKSHLSDIANGVILGLGPIGYELALDAAIKFLDKQE